MALPSIAVLILYAVYIALVRDPATSPQCVVSLSPVGSALGANKQHHGSWPDRPTPRPAL
jgi:hypothetical protein